MYKRQTDDRRLTGGAAARVDRDDLRWVPHTEMGQVVQGADADDLHIDAILKLPELSLAAIRKLKDGDDTFLWQKSYADSAPETILGRPVIEAPDMPEIGSGTIPIVFGDFNAAYRIYDRLAISIMRDPYTRATNGLVRFHARRRVGGGMVLPEAVKAIKCATS